MGEEHLEPFLVDADAVADRVQLGVALHRPGMVELDVERHELEPVECRVVPHRHDVVEAVDAHAPPARVPPVDEHLLEHSGAMLADVARLAREDDQRVAVRGDDDIRVAVDDLEPGEVRHRPLEAGVLGARHDERVELSRSHRCPDVGETAFELCP